MREWKSGRKVVDSTMSDGRDTSPTDRAVLVGCLSSLLEFEDGVSDVFEHILEIETSEDLLDYLSQLLGDAGEEVRDFVDDVGRFKRGESILSARVATTSSSAAAISSATSAPSAASASAPSSSSAEVSRLESDRKNNGKGSVWNGTGGKTPSSGGDKNKHDQRREDAKGTKDDEALNRRRAEELQQQQQQKKKKEEENDRRLAEQLQREESSRLFDFVEDKGEDAAASSSEGGYTSTGGENGKGSASEELRVGTNPKKPKHGKAKTICGCYGTRHKPLTNCLQCGRIACRHEGYGFCPFCGYDIEKVKVDAGDKKFDRALLHKERLLRYDREFARRTVVLDDQADYFHRESSAWLTEDERAEAERKDEDRRREMHGRKKPVLNIAL